MLLLLTLLQVLPVEEMLGLPEVLLPILLVQEALPPGGLLELILRLLSLQPLLLLLLLLDTPPHEQLTLQAGPARVLLAPIKPMLPPVAAPTLFRTVARTLLQLPNGWTTQSNRRRP